MGDFNTEEVLQDFLEQNYLSNRVHFAKCFKSLENPSTISMMITYNESSFSDANK